MPKIKKSANFSLRRNTPTEQDQPPPKRFLTKVVSKLVEPNSSIEYNETENID